MSASPDRPVTLAAVAGAHGVRGEVRLKLFAESLDSFTSHKSFDAGGRTLTLRGVREGSSGPVARFAEVTDRNAAEALRGQVLTVPRSALPPLGEGEYYWHDLIDLPVLTEDGKRIGRVESVDNHGASDLITVERPDAPALMLPVIPAAIQIHPDRLIVGREWLEQE
ncbi:MAG: ribosome maturation factor RimM [Sphingomonadaceae bacterium]